MIFRRKTAKTKDPPEKALCALWAGRSVSLRGYEAFAPSKRECPLPWGCFFPGVLSPKAKELCEKQRNPEKESLSI
jgi:hypothetical protein